MMLSRYLNKESRLLLKESRFIIALSFFLIGVICCLIQALIDIIIFIRKVVKRNESKNDTKTS
jgi:hypothetical protein